MINQVLQLIQTIAGPVPGSSGLSQYVNAGLIFFVFLLAWHFIGLLKRSI